MNLILSVLFVVLGGIVALITCFYLFLYFVVFHIECSTASCSEQTVKLVCFGILGLLFYLGGIVAARVWANAKRSGWYLALIGSTVASFVWISMFVGG